ncbi:hypothetical protein MVI01_43330 [Myxococcus virescens]|uniref:Uncharacterized protein n=1 Tax=Myxococcus virescens TaxID=83456 RepID=A0A511HJ33_9BACT|nr:hypothetical protein MVI01_43330 [Myxococcus virescens]
MRHLTQQLQGLQAFLHAPDRLLQRDQLRIEFAPEDFAKSIRNGHCSGEYTGPRETGVKTCAWLAPIVDRRAKPYIP